MFKSETDYEYIVKQTSDLMQDKDFRLFRNIKLLQQYFEKVFHYRFFYYTFIVREQSGGQNRQSGIFSPAYIDYTP